MEDKKELALKVLLIAIAIYHVFLGMFAFLSDAAAVQIAKIFFGMNIVATPQLSYIAKLLGIYALFFGIFMFIASRNPQQYRAFICGGVALYAVRVINRIIFAGLVTTAFGVSGFAFWMEIVLLAFFGGLLFWLMPKEKNA